MTEKKSIEQKILVVEKITKIDKHLIRLTKAKKKKITINKNNQETSPHTLGSLIMNSMDSRAISILRRINVATLKKVLFLQNQKLVLYPNKESELVTQQIPKMNCPGPDSFTGNSVNEDQGYTMPSKNQDGVYQSGSLARQKQYNICHIFLSPYS